MARIYFVDRFIEDYNYFEDRKEFIQPFYAVDKNHNVIAVSNKISQLKLTSKDKLKLKNFISKFTEDYPDNSLPIAIDNIDDNIELRDIINHQPIISQNSVIKKLNAYLKFNGLPLNADKKGICHGLAAIFIKYAAENKITAFAKNLRMINSKKTLANKASLNKFIQEILFAYLPSKFDPSLSQNNSLSLIPLDGTRDKMAIKFQISKEVTTKSLATLLEKITFDGAMFNISSEKHTIAMLYKDNKYKIYDPNQREIRCCIDNPAKAIHKFLSKAKTFGINIEIIEHPKAPLQLLDQSDLFTDLSDKDLELCAKFNNEKQLAKSSAKNYEKLLFLAIANNSHNVLHSLLKDSRIFELHKQKTTLSSENYTKLAALIETSIRSNNAVALNALLSKNNNDINFITFTSLEKNDLLSSVLKTGNLKIFNQVFRYFDNIQVDEKLIKDAAHSGKVNFFKEISFHLKFTNKPKLYLKKVMQKTIANRNYNFLQYIINTYPKAVNNIKLGSEYFKDKIIVKLLTNTEVEYDFNLVEVKNVHKFINALKSFCDFLKCIVINKDVENIELSEPRGFKKEA